MAGNVLLLFLVLVCVETAFGQDPNVFCFPYANRRNQRDIYADPSDCHRFVQCFYYSDTVAISLPGVCPPGTFWHDGVLQCLPEGDVPCTDICNNETPPAHGCYGVENNCATFYVCSNSASYPFCCPPSTSFNSSTCACVANDQCNAKCTVRAPKPVEVSPPVVLSSTTCRDSFGNTLRVIDAQPGQFAIWDDAVEAFRVQFCAQSTTFQLESCRCDVFVESNPLPQNRQCGLYLPFDTDIDDHSISDFDTSGFGGFFVDPSTSARGTGSLRVRGGRIEIPGLKSIDFKKHASWCFFFKLQDPTSTTTGGVITNSAGVNGVDQSIIVASTSGDSVQVLLKFANNNLLNVVSTNTGSTANTASGFGQICLVNDGDTVLIYRNGELVSSYPGSGDIAISHYPYVIGTDVTYGDYSGWIDEVLVCNFALTNGEVSAHWTGPASLVAAGLVPSPSNPTPPPPPTNPPPPTPTSPTPPPPPTNPPPPPTNPPPPPPTNPPPPPPPTNPPPPPPTQPQPPAPGPRECLLYLPFDADLKDNSYSNFQTVASGNAQLDLNNQARGLGSLSVSGGNLKIPGLASWKPGTQASFCLYFLTAKLNGVGGLLSSEGQASVVLASQPGDAVEAILNLSDGDLLDQTSAEVKNKPQPDEFTQVCLVLDNGQAKFYRNGAAIWNTPATGELKASGGAFVLGTDSNIGDLNGWIDEVLICGFAMTIDEVRAHWAGQPSMVYAGLLPSKLAPVLPNYSDTPPQGSPYNACGHNRYWNNGENLPISLSIIGGTAPRRGELPWQALLLIQLPDDTIATYCGASVLSDSWVLTAAHCCDGFDARPTGTYMTVLFGAVNLEDVTAQRGVSQRVMHPNYNPLPDMSNDFCLLKTDTPIPLNSWSIRPICLPNSCESSCQPGDPVVISGFGSIGKYDSGTYNGPFPNLAMTVVDMLGADICGPKYRGLTQSQLIDRALVCAGKYPAGGLSICQGDSGGPLACYKNGYFELIGATSFAAGCGDPGRPSYFAEVCRVLPWIKGYTGLP